jgi:hypothetical protein
MVKGSAWTVQVDEFVARIEETLGGESSDEDELGADPSEQEGDE